jgi:hypothetical protein
MIEPATALGLGLFGGFINTCVEAAFSHTVGGEAHHAFRHLMEAVKERLRDGQLPEALGLQEVANESFLESVRAFAFAIAVHVEPQRSLIEGMRRHFRDGTFLDTPLLEMTHVAERDWIKALLATTASLQKDGNVMKDFALSDEEVIALLFERTPDKLQKRINTAFAGWVHHHVQHSDQPSCVEDFLANGWLIEKGSTTRIEFCQAFNLFFREKIQNRPEIFRMLVGQTLSEIAHNQKKLNELPGQVAQILEKFNSQCPPSFDKFQAWLADQFALITTMLKVIEVHLTELKSGQQRLETGQTQTHDKLDRIEGRLAGMPAAKSSLLPPMPTLLVGREEVLRELKACLIVSTASRETPRIQVLTAMRGLPGVGKTTTAAALAHDAEVLEAFPDGILWTSLGQKPELWTELASWGRATGVDDLFRCKDISEASARMAGHLLKKRMLLIVDDVWEASHAVPFMIGGPGCSTLVTTRETGIAHAIAPTGDSVYQLKLLTNEQALELFQKLAPSVAADFPEDSYELVKELEGLPLGIQVAGRMLNVEAGLGFGVKDLLSELRAGKRILEAQAPADRADVANETIPTVAVLLQKSTDRLDSDTRERYAYLAAFAPKPATFDARAMKAVWLTEDPNPTIRKLIDRGLLEFIKENGRYQMHALLVLHARSLCTDD